VIDQLPSPSCSTCDQHLVTLYACLKCVFLGCEAHIKEHERNLKHSVFAEFSTMKIKCLACGDFVEDADCDRVNHFEKVRMANIVTQVLDPLFMRSISGNWTPNNSEMEVCMIRA
jgi:ubiquitin carboxyl-terminal hydrolase 22/27/51